MVAAKSRLIPFSFHPNEQLQSLLNCLVFPAAWHRPPGLFRIRRKPHTHLSLSLSQAKQKGAESVFFSASFRFSLLFYTVKAKTVLLWPFAVEPIYSPREIRDGSYPALLPLSLVYVITHSSFLKVTRISKMFLFVHFVLKMFKNNFHD